MAEGGAMTNETDTYEPDGATPPGCHKVFQAVFRVLRDVHGDREAPPDDVGEIADLVGKIEQRYRTWPLRMPTKVGVVR